MDDRYGFAPRECCRPTAEGKEAVSKIKSRRGRVRQRMSKRGLLPTQAARNVDRLDEPPLYCEAEVFVAGFYLATTQAS